MTKEEFEVIEPKVRNMVEFIARIDNGFGEVSFNCGVFMPVNMTNYLVINTRNYGTFLTADQLVTIAQALVDNQHNVIKEINPDLKVVICEHLNAELFKCPKLRDSMFGLYANTIYKKMWANTEKAQYNHVNLASSVKLLFTDRIAGTDMTSNIKVRAITCDPTSTAEEEDFRLVGFHPENKRLLICKVNKPGLTFVVDPKKFNLVLNEQDESAKITKSVFSLITKLEDREAQILLLQQKLEKDKTIIDTQTQSINDLTVKIGELNKQIEEMKPLLKKTAKRKQQ